MPNETLDPQKQDSAPDHASDDELEKLYNLPSAKRKDPVSADDLQQHYDIPSTDGYDSPSDAPSSPKSKDGGKPVRSPHAAEKSLYNANPGNHSSGGLTNFRPSVRGFMNFARQNRLKLALAGAAATVVTVIIVGFLLLIPLKILHIVNNLQSHFYSSSENAIQGETDHLFKNYIRQHVLPSYKSCGTTISRNCSVKIVGSNPVANMYRSWANARLENKLAEDYGIEFQRRPDGWYMKTPSTSATGINIGENGEKLDSVFEKVGISDIRQAIKDETHWYQVYFRFKVGKLLEEKYGIRRCIIFCSITDPLAQKVADQKLAAKLYLVQRVIVPRNQTLGIVLECFFTDCTASDTTPTDEAVPGEDAALGGAPENAETDTAIRDGLTKLAASYGVLDAEAIDQMVEIYTEMSEKGFQNYLITKALTPIIGETAAGTTADKIPIVGWIDLAARLVNAANDSSKSLKKLSYITNATAAVALFAMYRTYADEINTGHANATEVGSFTDSLGPGNQGSTSDPEVGGNAEAEQTPLYDELIDGESSSSSSGSSLSLLNNLFSSSVMAAGTDTNSSSASYTYKCNDGNPVPSGQLVCDEEILGSGSRYADLIHKYLNNNPFGSSIIALAQLWRSTIGHIFNGINSVLGAAWTAVEYPLDKECGLEGFFHVSVNPYCSARDAAKKAAAYVLQAITQALIPDPFGSNMSGGRTFDMMAAGADVAGNDSAHTTLGGQQLTDQQAASIVADQNTEALQDYKNEPFFSRMFDTNSNYSPVTKLAMAIPSSKADAIHEVASFFSSPFQKLASAFGSIFSIGHAFAAITPQPDPFGVTQYGYPQGTIPSDPETYWNQNCSNNAAYAYRKDNSWNENASKTLDANEMPLNTQVNPCLLIMATTGSDGGFYDSSLLTKDDLSSP